MYSPSSACLPAYVLPSFLPRLFGFAFVFCHSVVVHTTPPTSDDGYFLLICVLQ
jgi:hypothetical protein